MISAADSQSTAHAAKAIAGLTASSTPPSAGPATTATCAAELDAAIARGRTAGETMLVSTDCRLGCSKARPAPTTNAIASTRAGVSCPMADGRCQNGDRERLDGLRGGGDRAAVVAVRRVAGGEKQHDGGNELDQPDEAELERASGQLIHLPADCDRLHLQRD